MRGSDRNLLTARDLGPEHFRLAELSMQDEADERAPPDGGAARNDDGEFDVLRLLRAVGDARKKNGLSAEEALIFLALGRLGLRCANGGTTVWPVTCHEISDLLRIPRETVRRKSTRLIKFDLASATGRGLLLKDIESWRAFVARLAG